jgi:hypothetical protein
VNRRDRELSQLLSAIADQAGARLIAVQCTGSGHRKAVFIKGDRRRFVIAGSTPSDRRDRHNTAPVARRVLR